MLCNTFLIYNLVRIFQKTIYIFNQRKLIIYIYFTKDNGRDGLSNNMLIHGPRYYADYDIEGYSSFNATVKGILTE